MHIWLRDVLRHDGDSKLPQIDLFVISSGHKLPSSFDEGDSVDNSEVLLVLLNDLCRVYVILHNLLIGAPCQKDVLLV